MKPATTLTIILLTLVAVMHLLRLCLGWDVIVNAHNIPTWVSIVGVVIPASLAFMLWRDARR